MEDSVFTRIIRGELPSHKVYEDNKTMVIVPLHPIAKGHLLVIPKMQVDQFYELPEDDYAALWSTVKKTSQKLKQTLNTKRVGLKVIGLDIPHAHIHVIAFDELDEYNQTENSTTEPDHTALASIAETLKF
ncbi:MAG: HIT domain-containing protein [Candidatus Saccharibacteria bacterium]